MGDTGIYTLTKGAKKCLMTSGVSEYAHCDFVELDAEAIKIPFQLGVCIFILSTFCLKTEVI